MSRYELLIRNPDNGDEVTVRVTAGTPEHAIAKGERLWPDCPILAWREAHPEPALIVGMRSSDLKEPGD